MSWPPSEWLRRFDRALELLERYVKVREREAKVAEDRFAHASYDPEQDEGFDGGSMG